MQRELRKLLKEHRCRVYRNEQRRLRDREEEKRSMNQITMKLQADHLIMEALKEDISSEDVTTNSVMK